MDGTFPKASQHNVPEMPTGFGQRTGGDLILLDEKKARKSAVIAGFEIMGLLGLFILAKNLGLIHEVPHCPNYYVDDKVIRENVSGGNMPKLKNIDINYEQIRDLVFQLEFEKKMTLIKDLTKNKTYQKNFYKFTELLKEKHNILRMTEDELDNFLHS